MKVSLIKKNQVQIENIEITLEDLKKVYNRRKWDNIIKAATASFLGQIYNGLEIIFENILKSYGIKIKKTNAWHKNLLDKIREKNIFGKKTIDTLQEYRRFRHLWRHSYSSLLKTKEIKKLVEEIFDVYDDFKKDYNIFVQKYMKKNR